MNQIMIKNYITLCYNEYTDWFLYQLSLREVVDYYDTRTMMEIIKSPMLGDFFCTKIAKK